MRAKTPCHYARLLAAQKLLRQRDEAELTQLKCDWSHLEEENNLLGAMMAHGSYADFVNPLLLSQQMERNRRTQAQLTREIEAQINDWAKSNRRVKRLEEKYALSQETQTRAELTETIAEHIARAFSEKCGAVFGQKMR